MLPELSELFATVGMRLGLLAANLPAVLGDYQRHANVAYGMDSQHRLDVYVPNAPADAARPVVVFWHGGGWVAGDKADYRFVGAALAALGYLVILPNYRHYPQVKMQGFMDDAARAALWAAAHAKEFGGDVNLLYLMGHSAGAHLAALLSLDPRYFAASGQPAPHIRGLIGLSGPYDFLPLLEPDVQDMFGPPQNYPQSQPINFVHAGAPPMLLVHGLDDTRVSPKNSRNFAAALSACGVAVMLKLMADIGHADTVAALAILAQRRATTLMDIKSFVRGNPA